MALRHRMARRFGKTHNPASLGTALGGGTWDEGLSPASIGPPSATDADGTCAVRLHGRLLTEPPGCRRRIGDKTMTTPGNGKFPVTVDVSAAEFRHVAEMLRARQRTQDMPAKPQVYGYIRVSHYDGTKSGLSPEEQRDAIERYRASLLAQRPDLEAGNIYEDRGVSALKNLLIQRPDGRRLLAALRPGDHIIFKRLDRGFRRLADVAIWMDVWRQRGIAMHSTDIQVDTSTPNGRMVIHLLGTFAEYEGERIAERNRDIARYRRIRTRSTYLASGPNAQIGFDVMGSSKNRHLVPNPKMQEWMQKIVVLRDRLHLTFPEIGEVLSAWVLKAAEEGKPYAKWRDRQWTHQSAQRWYDRAKKLGIG